MVVGAHYDHDGEAYGQIWYGADDNGSGSAALLELAQAFGTVLPLRPAAFSYVPGPAKRRDCLGAVIT